MKTCYCIDSFWSATFDVVENNPMTWIYHGNNYNGHHNGTYNCKCCDSSAVELTEHIKNDIRNGNN